MDRFETELSEQEQKMEALEDTCLALVHSLQELEGAVRQQGAASGVRDDDGVPSRFGSMLPLPCCADVRAFR